MVDAIRTILSAIQASGQDGEEEYPDLVETLNRLQQSGRKPESKASPEPKRPDALKKRPAATWKGDDKAPKLGQPSEAQGNTEEIVTASQEPKDSLRGNARHRR